MTDSTSLEAKYFDTTANPFNVSMDSLSKCTDSVVYTTFIGKKTAIESNQNNSIPIFKTDTALFYLSLIIIIGISIYGTFSHINLFNFIKIGFFERFMQDHEKRQITINPIFNNALFFTSIVYFSIICYIYLEKNILSNSISLIYLLYIIGIVSILILLKILLHFLIGKIFSIEEPVKTFLKSFRNMYASSIFMLVIITFIMLSSNEKISSIFFIISIILLLINYIYRDLVFLLKQKSLNQIPIYFFLYFCTIEILSLPLLIKILHVFVNQIFV